ncbi:hypothetical protein [Rufibacter latericius]|uniref:Uncharacterized protein n=1 Tax=Rufibacter latericius TaxID=2487040 RepID=A0A3M9MTI5_9BACT|nr:hypothetical protein [Rufibacter latericius]RNI28832.1 hypothetical protein EFB08_09400 [Rufibacter latericius]
MEKNTENEQQWDEDESHELMDQKMREEEAHLAEVMFVTRMSVRVVQRQLFYYEIDSDYQEQTDPGRADSVETEQSVELEQYEELLSLVRRLEAARAKGTMTNESLKDPNGSVNKRIHDEMGQYGNVFQVAQEVLEMAKHELDMSYGDISDMRSMRARNKPGFMQQDFLATLDWNESLQVLIGKLQEIQKKGYL